MNFQEFQAKSKNIINESLVLLESILDEVDLLDPIIKENQISDFIMVWRNCVSNNIGLESHFSDKSFKTEFSYLINRMTTENKIKERIIELTNSTNSKINSLS